MAAGGRRFVSMVLVIAAGCDRAQQLELRFLGLDGSSADVAVELSAAGRRFAGEPASAGGIAVSYPDGRVAIALPHDVLVQHGYRVRLGMQLDGMLALDGDALAGGRHAYDHQALAAGADAVMTFDFTPADAALDAPPADLAMPDLATADLAAADLAMPDLAMPDLAMPDLAMPDLAVADLAGADLAAADLAMPDLAMPDLAAGDLAMPDLAGPDLAFGCANLMMTPAIPASTNNTGGPVALAWDGARWGVAFHDNTTAIRFNAFANNGALQCPNGVDCTVANAANTGYSTGVGLAAAGGRFFAAYGVRTNGNGNAWTELRAINPAMNFALGNPVGSPPVVAADPPEDDGLAVFDDMMGNLRLATVVRAVPGAANASAVSGYYFDGVPLYQGAAPALATSYAAAVAADASARFGFAHLDNGGASGGVASLYDTALMPKAAFPFTGNADGDKPLTGTVSTGVAVAGAGGRFAVAWCDLKVNNTPQVFLAAIDAGNGARVPAKEVRVDAASATAQYWPALLWDGTSYVVVWIEGFAVRFRRFDPATLAPRDNAPFVAYSNNNIVASTPGFAAGAANEYGLAVRVAGSKAQFTRVVCTP